MKEPGDRVPLLRGLLTDLTALFPSRGTSSALLAIALLLVIAYWYLGAPAAGALRTPLAAFRWVLWAGLLLGLVPLLLIRPLGLDPAELGLGWGDWRAGRTSLLVGIPVVLVLGFLAGQNPSFRLSYPWPGQWAGAAGGNFVIWSAVYAVYYIAYEFFFRGFMLRGLRPSLGLGGSLWMQTAVSTLLHLGKPLVETLAALPAGLLFGLLALRTRSLVYVTVIHLVLGLATDLSALLPTNVD